ncbi:MAG: glutathione S-transferase family protein [Pseudomonadales bacterium]|nr:glutathione S-transferase family protein [Pseudomonadales bacterium]MBO6594860.1 glutathione S-transferase family protein [Pseudomonadales bacterium]MBO6701366.1 glutathione S-transferase family protein [Pseudomonadales bacterium]MBO6821580.1 glutathione S-transferase family protein [Pseudomonadales bacterium]MBO7005596.1 glutathione S-transferase family protein [Pseudomonadales bacterium]
MKLFKVALAPNPTKVMLYIAERTELGTDMGIEQITVNTVKGQHREPDHLARNPFGTVPALELDDGSFLKESLAIIQYLEERFPENALLSGSAEENAHARDLERIIDLRLAGPMGGYGHAVNSPLGYPKDPERAAQLLEAMQKPLDYVENLLSDDRPLFTGSLASIADCTMQASLQFMRFVEVDVMGDRPLLKAWDKRYRERPAAQAVLKW